MCFRGGGVVAGAEDAWPAGGGVLSAAGHGRGQGEARGGAGYELGRRAATRWAWGRRRGGCGRGGMGEAAGRRQRGGRGAAAR
jgi:hypothetical protein